MKTNFLSRLPASTIRLKHIMPTLQLLPRQQAMRNMVTLQQELTKKPMAQLIDRSLRLAIKQRISTHQGK
ncbi:hypothetical protein [Undibacterium sp. Dicai25W]|uniref:hypothetical protein n=1 Tax=Undibacterium sp. Dicai25W TaxID=3413034 RepID=UPI003BF508DE